MRSSFHRKSNQKGKRNSNSSSFSYALRLLSGRDYSEFEIKKKLENKFDKEVIENTIKKLVERRLLSDERYVKRIIEKYALVKKYGYLKVQYELLHRGVSYDIFNPILDEEYPEEKEKENALRISKKRPVDKLKRYLVNRGYRLSVVREVLAELKEQ